MTPALEAAIAECPAAIAHLPEEHRRVVLMATLKSIAEDFESLAYAIRAASAALRSPPRKPRKTSK